MSTTILIIISALITTLLMSLISYLLNKSSDLPAILLLLSASILFIGIFLFGNLTIWKSETIRLDNVVVTKSIDRVHVDVTNDGKINTHTFAEQRDYRLINDSTEFSYIIYYNHYGVEDSRKLIYK